MVRRIDPAAVEATAAITGDGTHVYDLFVGESKQAYKIVDRYEVATGRYLESMLLPREATTIAGGLEQMAILYSDPAPQVKVVRWVRR